MMVTLHIIASDDINQLTRGARGESQNWDDLYRRFLIKSALLRTGKTTPLGNLLPLERHGLPVDNAVERLVALYDTAETPGVKAREITGMGRRRLGLDDAVKSVKVAYLKGMREEFEAEFGFIIAQLGHISFPSWEADKVNFSFLWRLGWEPIRQRAVHPGGDLSFQPPLTAHPIEAPYSAGIYLKPEDVMVVGQLLRSNRSELLEFAERKQIPAAEILPGIIEMDQAFAFASLKSCGLVEACDIIQ